MKQHSQTFQSSMQERAKALFYPIVLIFLLVSAPLRTFADEQTQGGATKRGYSETNAITSVKTRQLNQSLGRGINFGNALDAPVEGEWGVVIEDDWFELVADAGFDSIRLPVRWSAHANQNAPYTIAEKFFQRVDHIIRMAKKENLPIIINMHHYDELMHNPVEHAPRFVAMWRQIAARYADQSDIVLFELLNEPSEQFSHHPDLWNDLIATTLQSIRQTNPERTVMVGPVGYNGINWLKDLELPEDANLVVSVHFYAPMSFTHQGATWSKPVKPTGVTWHARQKTLSKDVEDWSWNTQVRSTLNAITINLEQKHSGFSLVFQKHVKPASLRMRSRGKVDLNLGCSATSPLKWINRLAYSSEEWVNHEISLEACPPDTQRIALMNQQSNAALLELSDLDICNDNGCRPLIVPAVDVMRETLLRAQAWGVKNSRPMHLGEFGAFDEADLLSRTHWTSEVQRIARDAGMTTAYWALGTRFGIYDANKKVWNTPLLDALLP